MNFLTQNKGIIIGVLVIVLVFIGYSIMKPATNESEQTVSRQVVGEVGSASSINSDDPAAAFVYQLLAIQNIRFNAEFFKDPVYRELIDRSRPLGEREVGRPNPFLEIGKDTPNFGSENDAAIQAQSTSEAQSESKPATKPTTSSAATSSSATNSSAKSATPSTGSKTTIVKQSKGN